MMIINDDSRIINKLETSVTDNARVVIYKIIIYAHSGSCLHYKPVTIVIYANNRVAVDLAFAIVKVRC